MTRPDSTFSHSAAWAQVLRDSYGYAPIYFSRTDSGHLRAALPVMETGLWLTGRRGVSLPFTDHCEALGSSTAAVEGLIHQAIEYGQERRWTYLELRGGRRFLPEAQPSVSFYGHTLGLAPDQDFLRAGFDRAVWRAIRKAEKAGVTVEFSQTLDAVRSFYLLHCKTRKRQGLRPHPFRFFTSIHQHIFSKKMGFVAVARHEGKPVAAAVFFHWRTKAIYKYGASDDSVQHLRADHLIAWQAIKRYALEGFDRLDFGRTPLADQALRELKLSWGAFEHKIEYFRYHLRKSEFLTAPVGVFPRFLRQGSKKRPPVMATPTGTSLAPENIGSRLAIIADRLPGKVAIAEGKAAMTYGQLDTTATAIARRLAAGRKEHPGFVCLLFESKIAAIKAIFGASRCGRAYVPLDASDPDERLRFILQDSEPIALMTEGTLLERAHALIEGRCPILDVDRLESSVEPCPLPQVSSDALAYLFYTSGSTGRPKGVAQTQGNLLFFADAYSKTLQLGEADRLSLLYSLSFSAANMDIFGGLLNGATLFAYDLRRDGIPLLADWLERERITVLHAVPTVFRELMNRLAPERKLGHLRAIDLGGESVFETDVELFKRHTCDHCILINHLAATEASVIAQHLVDHRSRPPSAGILPVGRTPAGLRVTIRREDGTEAERNEIGQIVASSPCVSPGYWRRPELNAAAFSADTVAPGSRLYFTGDLGRIDQDDNLHFLGRSGSRIKIRGHSVDLTEVEAALSACDGVAEAAVVASKSKLQPEAERLVAYVAMDHDTDWNPLLLRRQIASRLPSYMVPARFVSLDALPITATGKIDRIALAEIQPRPDPMKEIERPENDLERTVARTFEQLLKQRPIGRGDDFFLLGGDSLSVVELQIRLRDAFGVSLSNFYEDATVAGIAEGIRRHRAAAPAGAPSIPVLLPLRERGSAPPLFLVHGRLGQALVSPHFLQLLGENQPVWAFQARGLDGRQEPHPTIETMAAEYLEEMRTRRPKGPYFLGALCSGAFVAIVMARSLVEAGESVLPLLLLDPPERPFQMAGSSGGEERMLGRLKSRQQSGRIAAALDDPVYAKASVRAAIAFEQALRKHQPQPYTGPVCILSSRQRMLSADPLDLNKIFRGKVERAEVAATHADILDAHNPLFASSLARCLGLIHEAAKER